jgi:hypothetical protein
MSENKKLFFDKKEYIECMFQNNKNESVTFFPIKKTDCIFIKNGNGIMIFSAKSYDKITKSELPIKFIITHISGITYGFIGFLSYSRRIRILSDNTFLYRIEIMHSDLQSI